MATTLQVQRIQPVDMRVFHRTMRRHGVKVVWIWVPTFGGDMAIGKWYVGPRTLYRLYDGSFEAEPFEPSEGIDMHSWGDWWKESDQVNGYRHNRMITRYQIEQS